MRPKLGIIAGGGGLPGQLIEACRKEGRPYFVLAIEDAAEMEPVATGPHAVIGLGAVGDALNYLKSAGVKEVVLAGAIKRPSFSKLKVDAVGAKLVARMGLKLFAGDDALLREIVRFLESEGFDVVGAESVTGSLLAEERVYGRLQPDARAREDIALGLKAARALGALDIGQAVIVESGYVLGVEAAEGTQALIARCAGLLREKGRAVLVKAAKPEQETRADLPAIGPDTVRQAKEAGLAGIAVEASGAVVLDREEAVRLADELGLFVAGVR